jgi:tRNA(Arg) A34 adenosine deaminase TadA
MSDSSAERIFLDESLLRRAIELAAEARALGDPPFGSLLADAAGNVIAEQRNTTLSDNDIAAHPELKLARWAAAHLTRDECGATTMYTSCEPCSMCAAAIARANLARVVYALSTEQLKGLQPAGYLQPGSVSVPYDGPGLPAEAGEPVRGYY